MTPRPRAASVPRAAALCCTNPRVSAATLYTAQRKGAPRGRSLKPCLSFPFTFFFFLWKREEQSVRFCPIYVSTREQTLVVCVCVFLCWFFKEMGRRKKNSPPLSSISLPPSVLSTGPPSLFCFVLFCYESTFLFVILGSPGFLFSVKSRYASSALRLLLPPPGPGGLGGAWPASPPTPPPLSPLSAPSSSPCWERAESGRPRRARTSGAQRAPSRRAWARGRLMSRLGKGLGVFDLRLELANAPLPFGKERFRGGKGTAPAQGRKEEADTY